jgi:hypothetical protein
VTLGFWLKGVDGRKIKEHRWRMLKLRKLSGNRAKEVEVGRPGGLGIKAVQSHQALARWHAPGLATQPSLRCSTAVFCLACKTTSIQTGGAQIFIQSSLNPHRQQLLPMFRPEFFVGSPVFSIRICRRRGWAFIPPRRDRLPGSKARMGIKTRRQTPLAALAMTRLGR